MFTSVVFAQTNTGNLNIFSEEESTDIYLDNEFIGKGTAKLNSIPSGKHYLKASHYGDIVFSDLVNIPENNTEIILVRKSNQTYGSITLENGFHFYL
jgi:hypothetical protein